MTRIKRKVIGAGFVTSPRHGRNRFVLILECGHEAWGKAPKGIPQSRICTDCGFLSQGARFSQGPERGHRLVETWDAEKQWPKREIINTET